MRIYADGNDITEAIGALSWKNTIAELSTTMTFDLPKDLGQYSGIYLPTKGGIISMYMSEQEVFRGIILSVDDGAREKNTYTAADFGFYLNKNQNTYQFNDVPAKDALERLISDYDIPVDSICDINYTVKKIYLDQTMSGIIADILTGASDKTGFSYNYDVTPKGLRVYRIGDILATPTFRLADNLPEVNSIDYKGEVTHRTSIEELKNSVKVIIGGENGYQVQATAKDPQGISDFGLLQAVVKVDDNQKGESQKIAVDKLTELDVETEEYSFKVIEDMDSYTRAGCVIEEGGETYIVEGTDHNVDKNTHFVALHLKTTKKPSFTVVTGGQEGIVGTLEEPNQADSYSTSYSGGSGGTVVDKAVSWAVGIANDSSHGYDQGSRWGPDYDCSSLVISAYKQAGINVRATYTGDMYRGFTAAGFKDVTKSVSLGSGAGTKKGDILLNVRNHTVMVIEDGGRVVAARVNENGGLTGGKRGDQTGKEIMIQNYYNYPWNYVLRYGG